MVVFLSLPDAASFQDLLQRNLKNFEIALEMVREQPTEKEG